jgi:two-component system nitrogen regulation response regulator NtrX
VLLVVKNALERVDLQTENQHFRELVGDARLIGSSAPFRQAVHEATQVARSDAGVLLTGESGTGKELLAAHIHRESPLAARPFIKVNCAAIPTELIESELFGHEKGAFTGAASARRGRFELADEGTIFLDEVGDLHEASQAKLLRVLQDGEVQRLGGEQPIRVSVRVISATNRRLDTLIAEGKFRQDLFYRLSVVPIRVPSLRERPGDVRELAAYFLADFCARNNVRPKTLDDEVTAVLERYDWPGNVRELRNAIERMAILTPADRLTVESIPSEIRTPARPVTSGLHQVRDAAERESIRLALDATDWNVSAAARTLGIERTNLHKRIKALNLVRGRANS